MTHRRSDLALESRQLWVEENGSDLNGLSETQSVELGFPVTTVHVLTDEASKQLGKPVGGYVTVELGRFLRREDDAFESGARVVADQLRSLLPDGFGSVLVVGLGNPLITPDAVGHETVKNTLVTRHLRQQMSDIFGGFGDVAAIEPGVLGSTGIESVSIVDAVVREVKPSVVIAVDALASRSVDRVCRTIQISDTGIVPGSGVGNARKELSRNTLGVPVLALGVPTVVDAATLAIDLAAQSGKELDEDILRRQCSMIVTPKDIDSNVRNISRLIGYGLNLALHQGLTVEDIDLFIG